MIVPKHIKDWKADTLWQRLLFIDVLLCMEHCCVIYSETRNWNQLTPLFWVTSTRCSRSLNLRSLQFGCWIRQLASPFSMFVVVSLASPRGMTPVWLVSGHHGQQKQQIRHTIVLGMFCVLLSDLGPPKWCDQFAPPTLGRQLQKATRVLTVTTWGFLLMWDG